VLEVPIVPQGVAYVFVVWALGVEDVVQCLIAFTGCPSGMSDRWSGSVDLLTGPLLAMPVGLRVRVTPRCKWCRFCSSDEVLGSLISGDVEVCHSKQLFGGGRRFLQYGSDEGRVIRSPVEVLNHCCLSDLTDTISHGLKPLEVRPECFIASAPDGFEVPWLRRLVGEGLEVGDETPTEVTPIVDVVSRQML
jgi:hypothetical protein